MMSALSFFFSFYFFRAPSVVLVEEHFAIPGLNNEVVSYVLKEAIVMEAYGNPINHYQ